jgi:hypothetical protein
MVPAAQKRLYRHLLESRLPAVLNDRYLLARGRPVKGLLCGRAYQPIPEGIDVCKPVDATLSLTDDTGKTVALRIRLTVDRSMAPKQTVRAPKRKGGLLDKRDPIVSAWSDREARPVPPPAPKPTATELERMEEDFFKYMDQLLEVGAKRRKELAKDALAEGSKQ